MKWLFYIVLFVVALGILGRIVIAMMLPRSTVTSWWRNPVTNFLVGGMESSRHLVGLAYDVAPPTPTTEASMRRIFPIVVNEGDHIHAQWF